MVFTNVKEEKEIYFGDLSFGDCFHIGDNFYMKVDIDDDDGDYYAIDLRTGEGTTVLYDAKVEPITIKEIIYENKW